MTVPDAKKWARKFQKLASRHGWCVACDLDAVFEELRVPSGIQKKLRDGLQQFKDGTIGQSSMPQGDLDETAPTQKEDVSIGGFWGGLAATAVLVAAQGCPNCCSCSWKRCCSCYNSGCRSSGWSGCSGLKPWDCCHGGSVATAFMVGAAMLAIGDCLDGDTVVTMADRSKKKIKTWRSATKSWATTRASSAWKRWVKSRRAPATPCASSSCKLQRARTSPSRRLEDILFTLRTTSGQWSLPMMLTSIHPSLWRVGSWWHPCSPRCAGAKPHEDWRKIAKTEDLQSYHRWAWHLLVEGILSHSGLPPPKWRAWDS